MSLNETGRLRTEIANLNEELTGWQQENLDLACELREHKAELETMRNAFAEIVRQRDQARQDAERAQGLL